MDEFQGLAIDGERVEGSDGATTEVHNPANGEVLARVAAATAADVDRAVRVADDRFGSGVWRSTSPRDKRDVLRRIADLVRRDLELLARIESSNTGKPIAAARGEIGAVATTFDYYAGAVDKIHGHTIPTHAPGTLLTFREPVGVCGLVVPWNFPLVILSWKVAPALAMGNSVVAKPAGVTPLSALALADLAIEAGLPSGVFNVVQGDAVAVTGHWTKYGALYHIPYDCLLPEELPNLLVAGRCISVDHRTHHATKEIPACMATGQAAGTAAALAVAEGIDPTDVEVAALRGRLEAAGAIVTLPLASGPR